MPSQLCYWNTIHTQAGTIDLISPTRSNISTTRRKSYYGEFFRFQHFKGWCSMILWLRSTYYWHHDIYYPGLFHFVPYKSIGSLQERGRPGPKQWFWVDRHRFVAVIIGDAWSGDDRFGEAMLALKTPRIRRVTSRSEETQSDEKWVQFFPGGFFHWFESIGILDYLHITSYERGSWYALVLLRGCCFWVLMWLWLL